MSKQILTDEMFIDDLKKLVNKYKLKNCSFIGTKTNEENIGVFAVENHRNTTYENTMLTILNVGRLWQSAREHCHKLLGYFEKGL